ncbi:hypothetical protein LIER_07464 [Lithospermum erythrorhizon]|uniref:Uncharacterized protein n=1 Tax=Lithospermum erythrorhizon TaxID=34254 RepID=A0AAV3P9K4_LITER
MSTRKLKQRRSPSFPPSNSPEEFDPNTPKANLESNQLKRCSGVSKIKKQKGEVPNGIESEGGRDWRVLKKGGKRVDGCIVFSSETGEEGTRRKRGSGIKDGNLSKDFKRKRISDSFKNTLGVDLSKEFEGKNEKRARHSDGCRNERQH